MVEAQPTSGAATTPEPHDLVSPDTLSSRGRIPEPIRRTLRWARREVLLALLAAFIVGLGAGRVTEAGVREKRQGKPP